MKSINKLNIFLLGITAILFLALIYKIVSYKEWERFYYISNVSAPEEFPINIQGIWFRLPDGDFAGTFDESMNAVDGFYSFWGNNVYQNSTEPQLLPQYLFLEYIDYRTRNYYQDSISLPKEKMLELFKTARMNNKFKNLSSWDPKMGLEFHVGIANEGNIIFWLLGDRYEKEFYRVQLKPKPFPEKMASYPDQKRILDKEKYIDDLFKEIPDSIKTSLLKSKPNAQYKDSIPRGFENLVK